MLIDKIDVFTALTQSFATGYFTYFLLKDNDILNISNTKKEEKLAVVSLLSVINWSVFWFVQNLIKGSFDNLNNTLITALTALFSFVIILFLGLFVFPKVISVFYKKMNSNRVKNNKLPFLKRSIRDEALDNDLVKYIYVFDFDNKYISSGYLNAYQYDVDDYNELLLYAPKEPEITKTVDDVEKLYEKYDINILIDYEKRIKLYILPMDVEPVD